jgi:selenocysteine-specific translation elongation factor
LIDHAFPVKGIGTVILGVIKKGTLNAGGMVEIVGYDDSPPKKVIIRSIQKHDRDFKMAHEGDRVGLALKGNISPQDISRDNIIVSQGLFKHESKINAKIYINQFYKPKSGRIKPGDGTQYHVLSDLKVSPIKLLSGDEIKPGESGNVLISLEKQLVHDGNGVKGIITELNRFENKLRIIGYFVQLIE